MMRNNRLRLQQDNHPFQRTHSGVRFFHSAIRSIPSKTCRLSASIRPALAWFVWLSVFLLVTCRPGESVERPRIWVTPGLLEFVGEKAAKSTADWVRFKKYIDGQNHYNSKYLARSYALSYLVTGQRHYAQQAISTVLAEMQEEATDNLNETPPLMVAIALVYDWCYPELSSKQRKTMIQWLNDAFKELEDEYVTPWHNYAVGLMWAFGIAGYATEGDNPRAHEMIRNARIIRYAEMIEPGLRFSGNGGAWAESSGYGAGTVLRLIQYAEAVLTVTGENLFERIPFYRDRLAFSLFHSYPGIHEEYGRFFRQPYIHGDGGRYLKGHQNYLRASVLMLIRRFPGEPMAWYAQDWVSQSPANKMPHDWSSVDDVMWYNPQASARSRLSARIPLSHYAEGTGAVYMRSDWTEDATWVSFQCGDHFEYHQHLDQNSFTIWKYEDLAIDSGVYTWANSEYANNYYARTIAHNSMLVFDPDERYSWDDMRGGYKGVNDGGQRAWKLGETSWDDTYASWAAESVEYWLERQHIYDTGDIKRYEDTRDYVYVLGDATNAYRQDKVQNFTRQLVFLRPKMVIVFDRVRSLRPEYTKKWLLHFVGEPLGNEGQRYITEGEYELPGDTIIYTGEKGKLITQSIFPEKRSILKIGGEGVKDSWVNGKQFDPGKSSYGAWRIEVSPAEARRDDLFLHVLVATHASDNYSLRAKRIQGDSVVGAQIEDTAILFSTQENILQEANYMIEAKGKVWNLLCDVKPDEVYQILVDGTPVLTALSSLQRRLSFTLKLKGRHQIRVSVLK